MWNISYRRLLALLLFCLLSFSASAEGYWITEAELTELETALQTAKNELTISEYKLSVLYEQLQTLWNISDQQATALTKLSESFDQFVGETKLRSILLTAALIGTSSLCVFLALK